MGVIRYVCTHTWVPGWVVRLIYLVYRPWAQMCNRRNIRRIEALYENVPRETNGGGK